MVASGQIVLGILAEIAESGRQAVAAMFQRRATERPEGVLQPFGEGHIAFAAQDDVGMLEAGIGQAEVVETVVERRAGDGDGEIAHLGEVGQTHTPRFVDLAKDPRFRKATPLHQHRPDLPAWLGRVLERAIAASPEARFGDALELAQELEHGLARGAPIRSAPRTLYDRDPLRFWQIVAAVLGLALLATCAAGG